MCFLLLTSKTHSIKTYIIQRMALTKFQLAALFVSCFLLYASQSKALNTKQIGPGDECTYRGSCMFSQECGSRCGPPEFPSGTLGLCMASQDGSEYLCCCTPYSKH
ncbi:defensin-like protein 275 [Raphanus sativus]|uniref:Defensin-like protein 275 n=1 Tax=Raphanus sativus TaxID=3726 RepID=A0A6J0N4W3_RAPSA|nr:defensin-like protein 275 [Raphanus sativus]